MLLSLVFIFVRNKAVLRHLLDSTNPTGRVGSTGQFSFYPCVRQYALPTYSVNYTDLFLSFNMTAIAERFVLQSSAPAEGDPVPDFVPFAIDGFNWDASAHPERPVLTPRRIFDNNNGLIEFELHYLPAFIVRDHQPI